MGSLADPPMQAGDQSPPSLVQMSASHKLELAAARGRYASAWSAPGEPARMLPIHPLMDFLAASDPTFVERTASLLAGAEPALPAPPDIRCDVCDIAVTSEEHLAIHKRGAKHERRVMLTRTDEELANRFGDRPDSLVEHLGFGKWRCIPCDKEMCATAVVQHMDGAKHIRKIASMQGNSAAMEANRLAGTFRLPTGPRSMRQPTVHSDVASLLASRSSASRYSPSPHGTGSPRGGFSPYQPARSYAPASSFSSNSPRGNGSPAGQWSPPAGQYTPVGRRSPRGALRPGAREFRPAGGASFRSDAWSSPVSAPAPVRKKTRAEPRSYGCDACKVQCNSEATLNDHLASKKHARTLQNVAERERREQFQREQAAHVANEKDNGAGGAEAAFACKSAVSSSEEFVQRVRCGLDNTARADAGNRTAVAEIPVAVAPNASGMCNWTPSPNHSGVRDDFGEGQMMPADHSMVSVDGRMNSTEIADPGTMVVEEMPNGGSLMMANKANVDVSGIAGAADAVRVAEQQEIKVDFDSKADMAFVPAVTVFDKQRLNSPGELVPAFTVFHM